MPDFDTLLDQCLARLHTGDSLERILQDHPDQAHHMRPLLEVAARLATLPAPRARPSAYHTARQRMLETVDHPPAPPHHTVFGLPLPDFSFLHPLPGMVLLTVILLGLTWILSSLDLDPDPAGQQTPTSTLPTPLPSPTATPTATWTATITPTSTATLPVTDSLTSTLTTTSSPQPVFYTLTPTPTERERKDDPTNTPTPSETPPPTDTPSPPYPPPIAETTILTPTSHPLTPTLTETPAKTGDSTPTGTP